MTQYQFDLQNLKFHIDKDGLIDGYYCHNQIEFSILYKDEQWELTLYGMKPISCYYLLDCLHQLSDYLKSIICGKKIENYRYFSLIRA